MKKSALLQILYLMAIVISVTRCSSEEKKRPSLKEYSAQSQKEFESIEKNDLPRNTVSQVTIKPTPHRATISKEIPREKPKEILKNFTASSPTIIETTDTTQLIAKNKERLQEINQNLAFFCMKHRKDAAFKTEEHCLAFTKKVLLDCENKHKLINTVMVNCIKEQLKKR
jgi:hypothetical protein